MEVCRIKLRYLACVSLIVICQIGYHLMGGGIGSVFRKSIKSPIIGKVVQWNANLLQENPPIKAVSKKQSFPHESNPRKTSDILVRLQDSRLYLYTALLSNSSSEKIWDRLAITGWEHKATRDKQFVCCVKFKSGLIRRTSKANRVRDNLYNAALKPLQYVCCLSGIYKPPDTPISVTVSIKSKGRDTDGHCPVEESRYVRIQHVYSHPTQIAAISKVIYGNVSLINLVAWLEIHQTLGLNKVVFYSHRLGQDVSKVLHYYQTKNIVEVIPVTFPDPAYQTAAFSSLIKTYKYWVDEEITLVDAQDRLRGYKYVAVFDIDEYIIPWSNKTWVDLMEELSRSKPEASGFKISGYMYSSSRGVSSNTSLLQIGRYFQRSGATFNRVKYLFIPSRVVEAGLHPHSFAPKQGYNISTVPEKLAVLSHYRTCSNCHVFGPHFDNYNYRRFSFIEDRVISLLKKILD